MTIKELQAAIKEEIYSFWGTDPMYFAGSDDKTLTEWAKADARMLELLDKIADDAEQEVNETKEGHDSVNHPSHYTSGGIECIDALKAATEGLEGIEAVCTANAIKYLWRWKRKNGVEDLKKAVWYINRLIQEVEQTHE